MTSDSKVKIDQIIKSSRKTIGMYVDPQGRLVVRAPWRVSKRQIDTLVIQNQEWIIQKQAEARANQVSLPTVKYEQDAEFLYLGDKYRLTIVNRQVPPLRFSNGFYLARASVH